MASSASKDVVYLWWEEGHRAIRTQGLKEMNTIAQAYTHTRTHTTHTHTHTHTTMHHDTHTLHTMHHDTHTHTHHYAPRHNTNGTEQYKQIHG